ncbi:S8 family serine peptidase [Mycoplasma sp. 4013]
MKNRRKFLWALGMTSTIVLPIAIVSTPNTNKNIQWYEKANDLKLEVRDSFGKNYNLNSSVEQINNDYELKVLLNHKYLTNLQINDEKYIKEQNQNFINYVKKIGLKFLSSTSSRISPIVWFYFQNEDNRKEFIHKLNKDNQVNRFILYKNDITNIKIPVKEIYESPDNYYSYRDDLFRYEIKNKYQIYKTVNFEKQNQKDLNSHTSYNQNNVGVMEYRGQLNYSTTYNFFKNNKYVLNQYTETKEDVDDHGIIVSSIVGGKEGFDKKASIYFTSFDGKNSDWQKRLEDLIIDKGIRVINHSYGSGLNLREKLYGEESYIVDYLSRKYGVVNVFSAGNGNDGRGMNWINKYSLSYNSIVVGALNKNLEANIKDNRIASYSNILIDPSNGDVAKPFITAPGTFELYEEKNGTSFSAPVITGLLSTLLREKKLILDKDETRIPALKSILSASAISTNDPKQLNKSNGFSNLYGSGIPDFENMKIAADNLSILKINSSDTNDILKRSNSIYLNSGQILKASLSWMFNAGLLKNLENKPKYNSNVNWWWFLGPIGGLIANKVESDRVKRETSEWEKTHHKSDWLKTDEVLKKQKMKFSDYDFILEKYEYNKGWVEVARSESSTSNDELIEYKSDGSGEYRLVVRKYKSALFDNSVDDILAYTYVVQK